MQSADILPTILNLLGLTIPEQINGMSLSPLLIGGELKDRLLVLDGAELKNRVLKKGKWTLFIRPEGKKFFPYELYDTNKDPGEFHNVLYSNVDTSTEILNEYVNNYKLHN